MTRMTRANASGDPSVKSGRTVAIPGSTLRARVLCVALLLAARANGETTEASPVFVVPPGQEELISEMVGRGVVFPGGCRLVDGQVDYVFVRARYECADGDLVVELHRPGEDLAEIARTGRFSVVIRSGEPPAGFVEALAARVESREDEFAWKRIAARSLLETTLLIAAVVLPAAAFVVGCVGLTWAAYRRRRDEGNGEDFWLARSGIFGYGTVWYSDWIALIPFAIALALRDLFTLHSVQEIHISFAQDAVDRHSVLYPSLQLLYGPWVGDPHRFTMRLNGLLGAVACLPMYCFVRQRLESRRAGFLCALFLATHPLVTRFAPTDGPYSLLLVTWFSGLALLSAPALSGRALLGGGLFLGIAATLRVEGIVFLIASLLMLDARALIQGARRHRFIAAWVGLVVAALIAVQMHFVFGTNVGNFPPVPTAAVMLATLTRSNLLAALTIAGVLSVAVTRRWLGPWAFAALLVVLAPVAYSTHATALHRLVPALALQAMLAGIGAYALTAWIRWPRGWGWLASLPGVLAAGSILRLGYDELTKPYVFTEEYSLVRRHLAPDGASRSDCVLMTFNSSVKADADLHDFRQVVPGMRVHDCLSVDCAAAVSESGCFYYVRSVGGYFHPAGVPPGCRAGATENLHDCLNKASAAFESAVRLEAVEVRTVDVWQTFAEFSRNYPAHVEIGLFRVRPDERAAPNHQQRGDRRE